MLTKNLLKDNLEIQELNKQFESGKHIELNLDSFHQIGDLGKGAFGIVKKIKSKKTGKIYALKIMQKKNLIFENMTDQFKKESKIRYLNILNLS